MRRSQVWWSRLTEAERSELVYLEKVSRIIPRNDPWLPDGYSDCENCGTPTAFGPLCMRCSRRITELIAKGWTG